MADITPQEQEEFEFRHRYEQEQAAAAKKPAPEVDQVNPLMPTISGALAAETLGPAINKAGQAYMETQKLIKSGWDPKDAADFVGKKFSAVENWARQEFAGEFFGGKDKLAAYRAGIEARYPEGIPPTPRPAAPAAPVTPPVGMKAGPAGLFVPQSFEAATQAAPAATGAATRGALAAKTAGVPGLQSLRAALGAGLPSTVPAVIGRGLAGASAGFQGADAYNRLQRGDVGGALIGGLGALGSAASLLPHPVARIGGTAIGIGAEALNSYLDSLKDKPAMANGGSVHQPRSKAHAAAMRIMASKQ